MPSPDILVIEDGSVVTDANSYATYDYVLSYHALRGNSAWAAGSVLDQQYAIIRATQAIDGLYRWKGVQTDYGTQELQWPRTGVSVDGNAIDYDTIPTSLKKAIADGALKELETPNVLTPDLDRGGEIKSVKADTVEVEYMDGANSTTTFSSLDGILAELITGDSSSGIESFNIDLAG